MPISGERLGVAGFERLASSPVVQVVHSTDTVELPSGKVVAAGSIKKFDEHATLGKLIERIFECHLGHNRDIFLQTLLLLCAEANEENSCVVTVVKHPPMKGNPSGYFTYHYRLDDEETIRQVLLSQNKELEPYLPFRITEKEMGKLKEGNLRTKSLVKRRLEALAYQAGGEKFANLPDHEVIARGISGSAKLWEIILAEELPIKFGTPIYKYVSTCVHNTFKRHQRKLEARSSDPREWNIGVPLKNFFETNPPASPIAQALLLRLSPELAKAFRDHYFCRKTKAQISSGANLPLETVKGRIFSARAQLEKLVDLDPSTWPRPNLDSVLELTFEEFPEYCLSAIDRLPGPIAEYARLRYIDKLTVDQVRSKKDYSQNHTEYLTRMFRHMFIRMAVCEQMIRREWIDPKYYLRRR